MRLFVTKLDYRIITSFNEILTEIQSPIAFDLETTSLATHSENIKIVGIGLTWKEFQGVYLHTYDMSEEVLYKELKLLEEHILNNPEIKKWGQNIKYDIRVLHHFGIKVDHIDLDSQIASYSLYGDRLRPKNAKISGHSLDDISMFHTNLIKIRTKQIIPRKSKNNPNPHMGQMDAETVGIYCIEDTDATYRCCKILKEELNKPENKSFKRLLEEIEMPVYHHIIKMECDGVFISKDRIDELNTIFNNKLEEAQTLINDIAGKEILITKSDEISDFLFNNLKLHKKEEYSSSHIQKKLKKTKAGNISADQKILSLFKDHPLVAAILEAKAVKKLTSTYTTGLLQHMDKNQIIRTSFNQHITATGRLSSSSPINLQNIPNRREEGRAIRTAFQSRWKKEGGKFFSPDYSQCELRILAHLSQEPVLLDIFEKGLDAHSACAAAFHNIPLEEVTSELRGPMKSVNFGIIYGMTYKRLSSETGMEEEKAKKFIDDYLGKFAGINNFIELQKVIVREYGYTESIMGRRRYLPTIYSGDKFERMAAEREAVNHVIQASNADITKKAMIKIGDWLKKEKLRSLMVLQVHDELGFDVHPKELDFFSTEILSIMRGIADDIGLSVPLVCEGEYADDWAGAH